MRDLRIIVGVADAERLRGALAIAAAHAALGGRAALFLHLDAVALLRRPVHAPRDGAHDAAGLPMLATLMDDAMALGVAICACQSGLALAGMAVADMPDGIDVTGPVAFLRDTTDDARLLLV